MSLINLQLSLKSAYSRLTDPELAIFLDLRSLSKDDSNATRDSWITKLVEHDLRLYGKTTPLHVSRRSVAAQVANTTSNLHRGVTTTSRLSPQKILSRSEAARSLSRNRHLHHQARSSDKTCTNFYSTLPVELWALIMEYLDDIAGGGWEMSTALGIPNYMKKPSDWEKNATPIDHAILTGSVAEVKRVMAENSTDAQLLKNMASGTTHIGTAVKRVPTQALRFTEVGASVMCRFGYTNLLTYFWLQDPKHFISVLGGCYIPTKASICNGISVLDWWFKNSTSPPKGLALNRASSSAASLPTLYRSYNKESMDNASRNANLAVLEWWKTSGLPLAYSEAALEGASGRGHVGVLEWWKHSGLELKIGKVMDLASLAGHVSILDWWLKSGLAFVYDKALLNASSGAGGVDVLDWWKASGLRLVYDGQALVAATLHDRREVLDWWKNSGLPIRCVYNLASPRRSGFDFIYRYRICDIEEALEDAVGGGNAARAWWMEQGINFNASNKEWSSDRLL